MLKRTQWMMSAALCVALTVPVFADTHAKVQADTVVATVNGTEITLGHMIVMRAGLPEQYQNLPGEVLFKGILDQLVQQTLLSQEAGTEHPKRVALALENEARAMMAAERMDAVLSTAVTEAAVKEAYDARFTNAAPEQEFNAAHILVETEQEAKDLVTALEDGADFAELAKEKSTGPSGPRGGALGWFGKGMMVPAFEEAAMALEVGAISAPVKTQFGWHVIKLNETRAKDAPKLEDVRTELEGEITQNAMRAYIDGLVEGANITRKPATEIDPSVLGNLELLEN